MGQKKVLWTARETEILMAKYNECGSNIPELLETKTKGAIRSKANYMGLTGTPRPLIKGTRKYWTEQELELLRARFGVYGAEIPELLARHSRDTIRKKAGELGLTRRSFGGSATLGQKDIECSSFAYYGSDGTPWLFVLCRECRRVVLLSEPEIAGFEHGETCQKRAVPQGLYSRLPDQIRRSVKSEIIKAQAAKLNGAIGG